MLQTKKKKRIKNFKKNVESCEEVNKSDSLRASSSSPFGRYREKYPRERHARWDVTASVLAWLLLFAQMVRLLAG